MNILSKAQLCGIEEALLCMWWLHEMALPEILEHIDRVYTLIKLWS